VRPGITLSVEPDTSAFPPPSLPPPSPSLTAVLTLANDRVAGPGVRDKLVALDVLAELVPELIRDLPMRTTRLGRESPPPRDQPGRRRRRASASVAGSSAPSMWKEGTGSSAVEPVRAKDKAVLRVRGMKKPSLPRGMDRP
jgi:hypothetical protein